MIGLSVFLTNCFVTEDGEFWPRVLTNLMAAFVGAYLVAFMFCKFAGISMGHWLTGR